MKHNNNKFHLVLHAHLPFVLETEAEFWLYEAALNCYIPFINMMKRVSEKTSHINITINISPILLLQLGSKKFTQNLEKYINTRKRILSVDLGEFSKNKARLEELDRLEKTLQEFKFSDSIIKGFQDLADNGVINIITSALTHPLLPTIKDFPELINRQVALGKQVSEFYFGEVKGFWAPECAVYPELSKILNLHGLDYSFADPSAIQDCTNNSGDTVLRNENVDYFIRDKDATDQIWDPESGYPGQAPYQDFFADYSSESEEVQKILLNSSYLKAGFSIRSVTDRSSNIKEIYHFDESQKQAQIDAQSYLNYLQDRFNDQEDRVISAFFDLELFGHWWKEGLLFLELFFHHTKDANLNFSLGISKRSLELKQFTPRLSTWGLNNTFDSWINNKTKDLWGVILTQNATTEALFDKIDLSQILDIFLMQASDWTFLITYDTFNELSEKIISSPKSRLPQLKIIEEEIKLILS
ncbi:MAG: hypothetical protein ACRCS8_02225 [Brevinema sp.]